MLHKREKIFIQLFYDCYNMLKNLLFTKEPIVKLSKIANEIEPSLTRKLFNMAKQYDDVIDFTLGDPDYKTPHHVMEAACKAIVEGKTNYSANAGLLELREKIAQSIEKEDAVKYDPLSEIIVTAGAMNALYLSLRVLINQGDEVIIPSPYWVNYVHMVQMNNGIPVLAQADKTKGFLLTAKDIERHITSRTKVIIINNPNNPTGTVMDEKEIEKIAIIAQEKDIIVIWDEVYKSLVYDNADYTSIFKFKNMKNHAIVINSFSKKYSMTGWRVGYAVASAPIVSAMAKLQENIVACAPLPSQYAAIAALSAGDETCLAMKNGFESRRNLLVTELNKIDKISCEMPKGAFYAFVNIAECKMKSEEFAYKLLERVHVAVVPGITYGECCDDYIRIAYTMNEKEILEGVARIKEFIGNVIK